MSPIQILPVDALSEEPDQRALFDDWVAVHVRSQQALWGRDHTAWSAEELRGRRRGSTYRYADLAAVRAGEVVGMAAVAFPQHDNRHLAMLMLDVDPPHRRTGVGSALLEAAVATARDAGRTTLQADTQWRAGDSDEHGEFASAHGFVPAQTTIRSEMTLPADERQLTTLRDSDGVEDAAAFVVRVAVDDIPDDWLPGLAVLKQRMSTDAPQGDTTAEEEVWTPQRVRENLQWAREAGRHLVLAVAFEGERAVGFTELQLPQQDPHLAYQQDTLVLREARGHRLGIRLKAAAALETMRQVPAVTTVRTWNADDNAPMLAVNTELGYRPTGYLRVWELSLA